MGSDQQEYKLHTLMLNHVISIKDLKRMFKEHSTMCHKFTIHETFEKAGTINIKYSNPDEYGYEQPIIYKVKCIYVNKKDFQYSEVCLASSAFQSVKHPTYNCDGYAMRNEEGDFQTFYWGIQRMLEQEYKKLLKKEKIIVKFETDTIEEAEKIIDRVCDINTTGMYE